MDSPIKHLVTSDKILLAYFSLSSGEISVIITSYGIFVVEFLRVATSTHFNTCEATIPSRTALYIDAMKLTPLKTGFLNKPVINAIRSAAIFFHKTPALVFHLLAQIVH